MDGEIATFLAVAGLTAIGSFIQGTAGVGLGLFAAPLAILIDPSYVPGPMLVPMLATSILTAWRDRRDADWGGAGFALAGRLPSAILAGMTISLLSEEAYAVIFAVLILAAVVISVVGLRVTPSGPKMALAGFASGYMGTLTAIGGPPMVIVMQHQPGPTVRATLAIYFTVGAALSLGALAVFGAFTTIDLVRGLLLVPPTYFGFLLSRHGISRVDGRLMRPLLLALVTASAIGLLIRTLA